MTIESKPEADAQVSAEAQPKPEPRNKLNAPPITQAVPVTAPAGATPVPPPPITTQIPAMPMPPPTAQIPVTPPPAPSELDASAIADEVAEAIKRAFAGMGAGQ